MSQDKTNSSTWVRPSEVMALHRLKIKKKALQARMNRTCMPSSSSNHDINLSIDGTSVSFKRKNPFLM